MDSLTLSLILGAVILLLFYLVHNYTYWKRCGIPTASGSIIPPVGHLLPVVTGGINVMDLLRQIYEERKGASMVGLYKMLEPVLLICEPALVKTVMLTNFTSFHENGSKIDPELDPLLAKNPFFSYGETWMTGRKRLTYAFSSMRLKLLFETVKGVSAKFDNFLERRLKSNDKYEVELKYLFSKYTGEVVASAGFGIEGFCFDDKPNPAAFDTIGKSFLEPSFMNSLKMALVFFMPTLGSIFRTKFIPTSVDAFFRSIVKDVLENRKQETVPRNDFFQLMINLEKTEGEKIDLETVTAHALSFFVDGYETSSVTLSFVVYQLAVHKDIQNKLRDEITSAIARHNGEFTYEALKEMTYMDAVINESQRVYPALGLQTKLCTEEFDLEGSDGLRYRIKPGSNVFIATYGLQMDPKYWPNPEVFDPERFNGVRKQEIEKFAFLPFGEGPRMCVGMRMAMVQMKACLVALLMKYSVELSPKTKLPVKLSPTHFLATPVGGFWVNIRKI